MANSNQVSPNIFTIPTKKVLENINSLRVKSHEYRDRFTNEVDKILKTRQANADKVKWDPNKPFQKRANRKSLLFGSLILVAALGFFLKQDSFIDNCKNQFSTKRNLN